MDIWVTVTKFGEDSNQYNLNDGDTVDDALQLAKESTNGFEVRLNNKSTTLDTVLKDGDVITLVPIQIRGGLPSL